MDLILIIVQLLLIVAIGIILWQIWKYLHSELLPDDQPLGEERAKYITDRLDWIKYLLIAEVILFIIATVLKMIKFI